MNDNQWINMESPEIYVPTSINNIRLRCHIFSLNKNFKVRLYCHISDIFIFIEILSKTSNNHHLSIINHHIGIIKNRVKEAKPIIRCHDATISPNNPSRCQCVLWPIHKLRLQILQRIVLLQSCHKFTQNLL